VSASIRSHLAYRRLTQSELAEVLGISQTQVSARMRGEVRWTVNDLYLVAEWLDVAPSALLQAAA
jgi:transcriptional regulator with XRE-family HTH domain